MKREIHCIKCSQNKIFKDPKPYPGEYQKQVKGVLKRDCVCDFCGTNLFTGSECVAYSSWADYGGVPYFEWEHEFINAG